MWSELSQNNKVAIICVVLAATLGGVGYLVKLAVESPSPPSVSIDSSGIGNTNIIGDGNTVNSGIELPQQFDTRSDYLPMQVSSLDHEPLPLERVSAELLQRQQGDMVLQFLGIHRAGYPSVTDERPSYVKSNTGKAIEFQKGGFVWTSTGAVGRFALVNQKGGPYVVDSIYLKSHRYADCPLRDERTDLAAPGSVPAYAFYVSKEYNVYEIVPRVGLGDLGNWSLRESEADEFALTLEYPPYVLFVASLIAEVRDQSNGNSFRVASGFIPLLRVNGNTGGCLDLSRWFEPRLLKKPSMRAYSTQARDLLTYQIVTLDAERSRSFLLRTVNELPEDELRTLSENVGLVAQRAPANTVFRKNQIWLEKLVEWSVRRDGDPP